MGRSSRPDKRERPRAPEVALLIANLYASPGGGAGCCLHVLTDDGNIADGNARYVLEVAQENGHPLCIEIAEKLINMRPTARGKACGLAMRMLRKSEGW